MQIKRCIIKMKWWPSLLINKFQFCLRKIEYGCHLVTYGKIFVRGTGKIRIGNNVTITSCREMNPIGGDVKTILYVKKRGTISIGDNVGMSNVTIVSLDSITIEENVFIGGNCKIYDNDFHPLNYEQRMASSNENIVSKPITIKKGAFIGAHSIILKGVTIGEKSIIGAGSVVTKSIPDGEIWGGNPAKFIKKII